MANIDEEGFESKTEVEKIIVDIKEANINFENYKSYVSKIISTSKVISANIQSFMTEYKKIKDKLDKEKDNKQYQRAEEEGFIPVSVVNLMIDLNSVIRSAYSWKTLEVQMYNLIFIKISQVLEDAKALDIKRDALKEMREMETKRNELLFRMVQDTNKMTEDLLNNKLAAMDDKFINTIKILQQQAMTDKKDLLNTFGNIVKDLSKEKAADIEKMKESIKEKELDEKITKPIGKIEYEKTKVVTDKKQSKAVVEDNPFEEDELDDENSFLNELNSEDKL